MFEVASAAGRVQCTSYRYVGGGRGGLEGEQRGGWGRGGLGGGG